MRKETSDKKSLVKTTESLIIALLLFFAFLFSGVLPLQNEHSQSSMVTSVLASRALSSHTPRAFRSDSGQTHLLFLHETQEYDFGDNNFYHSYELEDRSWTVPFKLEGLTSSDVDFITNSLIIQNESREDDFSVYYNKEGELFKITYNGQSQQWSDSEKKFSKIDIFDYLDFQASIDHNILRFWIHSLFYLDDGAFNVVWSFESRNTSLFNHEYENRYLISTVFPNGTIQSQVIPSIGPGHLYQIYHRYLEVNFVSWNNTLWLYSPLFIYRSFLLPNGSWSAWQRTELYGDRDLQLIHNQYLLNSHLDDKENFYWTLTDLTATNLSVHPIQFPHKLDPKDTSIRATFKLRESTIGSAAFLAAFVTNSSIELWTYNLLNDTWTLISQLAYSQTSTYDFYAKSNVFSIDLLADGPSWRVFWNQQIKTGNRLHELFTVSYHTETGNWSQVTRITDTKAITDDFTGEVVPGFPLVILFLSFLITIVLKRIKRA